jgi:cytochrome oxidase Cu insertion factor (SCO1/SenC/PrrC family)
MGESRSGVMKGIALVGVAVVLTLGTWLVMGSEPRLGPHDGPDLPGIDTGRVAVGDVAPDFSLMTYAGTVTTLSDFRGEKNVVLQFYRGYW